MGCVIEDGRCIRARRALSAALDGEASTADVLVAAVHLGGCPQCRQFAAHIVFFTRELRSVRLGRTDMPR